MPLMSLPINGYFSPLLRQETQPSRRQSVSRVLACFLGKNLRMNCRRMPACDLARPCDLAQPCDLARPQETQPSRRQSVSLVLSPRSPAGSLVLHATYLVSSL